MKTLAMLVLVSILKAKSARNIMQEWYSRDVLVLIHNTDY
jgi:hypothetical protein